MARSARSARTGGTRWSRSRCRLTARSRSRAARSKASTPPAARARGRKAPRKPDVTLEEQIALFREAYAVGFDDATWKAANIEKAQKRLEKYLSARRSRTPPRRRSTRAPARSSRPFKSGVPKGDRERLHNLSDHLIEDFATALTRLLHGDADYARRFEAFASVLARGEGRLLAALDRLPRAPAPRRRALRPPDRHA